MHKLPELHDPAHCLIAAPRLHCSDRELPLPPEGTMNAVTVTYRKSRMGGGYFYFTVSYDTYEIAVEAARLFMLADPRGQFTINDQRKGTK